MIRNLMYIETQVLHNALTDAERVRLVERFKNPNDLLVLIIMYQISSQGMNMDQCYNWVIVAIPAIKIRLNIAAEGKGLGTCKIARLNLSYNADTLETDGAIYLCDDWRFSIENNSSTFQVATLIPVIH